MPLYQEVSLEVEPRSQCSFSEYTDADTSSAVADSPACGKRLPTNETGGRYLKTLGEESRILLESLGGLRVAWELGGYVERAKGNACAERALLHIWGIHHSSIQGARTLRRNSSLQFCYDTFLQVDMEDTL